MSDGRVVATGGPELAETLERDGYEPFRGATAVTIFARRRQVNSHDG